METKVIIIIAVVLVALLAIFVIATYNKLVVLRNRVRDSWATIEVELKRRFDLIPNIVESVKGYASHESDTLKGVIEARNKYTVAKTREEEMKANDMLTSSISKLFALSESYPDLKANQNFLSLQNSLEETENKIAVSRQLYNDTVLTLNNKVETFPSNIVAKIFGFNKESFFKAEEAAKEAPKVQF